MPETADAFFRPFPRSGRRRRKPFPFVRLAILGACVLVTLAIAIRETPPVEQAAPVAARAGKPVVGATYRPLLDPGFSLGVAPTILAASAPLPAEFRRSIEADQPVLAKLEAEPVPATEASGVTQVALTVAQPAPRPLDVETTSSLRDVPLPVARPSGLVLPQVAQSPAIPLVTARPQAKRTKSAPATATAAIDNRNFFEKLFGVAKPEERGPAMAYAAPQDDVVDGLRGSRLSPMPAPTTMAAGRTAVYDISARVVHMPNGERLEAHSGLGEKMDDPSFVHVRMHGPTPPHVYDLTEREALFHGVRAIRLNPVGGSGAIHGRTGLLAHTYLLGPRGDSNGCVSFKDYDRFLQAFLRGEVKRLVVVSGRG
ncbi:MAG: hypothetical protein DI527_09280 [Chelatococcus sp.]|nr:MAG: hypothetical protein DI527_09280 [Chelatococcus sp.]